MQKLQHWDIESKILELVQYKSNPASEELFDLGKLFNFSELLSLLYFLTVGQNELI